MYGPRWTWLHVGSYSAVPADHRTGQYRKRHSPRLTTIGIALLAGTGFATTLAARPAAAQTTPARSFDGDLFQPAIGPRNFLTLDAPDVLAHKLFSAGLIFDFQRFPY